MTTPTPVPENVNMLWAFLAVDACVRNGITQFVVSPGSRSTPLTTAVARHSGAHVHRAYDERGAAFWALGWARATGKPAVLISTSGTAVANYLPAVIEASQEGIPLLMFTADRPPELRETGANQTIRQPGLFGSYVRWEFDMPAPDATVSPRFVLTTVEQAIFRSQHPHPGPVHLNWMFREPLAPVQPQELPPNLTQFWEAWQQGKAPFTEYRAARLTPDKDDIRQIKARLLSARNGLIVVGGLQNAAEQQAVSKLIRKLPWPFFPDVRSGLQGLPLKTNFRYLDLALNSASFREHYRPDVILHVGMPVTSKRYLQWVNAMPEVQYIHISPLPTRLDPNHQVRLRIWAEIPYVVDALTYTMLPVQIPEILNRLETLQDTIAGTVDSILAEEKSLNEIQAVRDVSRWVREGDAVFLGNSLPIRLWDWFAHPGGEPLGVFANRGASGIDGLIATACGVAAGKQKPVTAIIGDISALHDLNSFLHLKASAVPVILIILNNSGGGIFRWLPVSQVADVFEKHFLTPHSLQFRHIARMLEIPYAAPQSRNGFRQNYRKFRRLGESAILELQVDSQKTYALYQNILEAINHAL